MQTSGPGWIMCSLSGTKPPLPSSKRLQPSTMERLIIVIPKYRHYYSHPPTIPQITFLLIIASSQDKWTEKFGCNPAPIPRLGRTFRTPSQRVKLQQEGYRGFLPNLGTSIARDIAQVPIILVIARRPLEQYMSTVQHHSRMDYVLCSRVV